MIAKLPDIIPEYIDVYRNAKNVTSNKKSDKLTNYSFLEQNLSDICTICWISSLYKDTDIIRLQLLITFFSVLT